jgi:hypothetical protein
VVKLMGSTLLMRNGSMMVRKDIACGSWADDLACSPGRANPTLERPSGQRHFLLQ